MSEPKQTCGTCANFCAADEWCRRFQDHVPAASAPPPDWGESDCHVRPTHCPPPGFLFTKRDGSRAQNVPRNERMPGSPWAWPACEKCDGLGTIREWYGEVSTKRPCPDCHGTGALRPAGKGHEVKL